MYYILIILQLIIKMIRRKINLGGCSRMEKNSLINYIIWLVFVPAVAKMISRRLSSREIQACWKYATFDMTYLVLERLFATNSQTDKLSRFLLSPRGLSTRVFHRLNTPISVYIFGFKDRSHR